MATTALLPTRVGRARVSAGVPAAVPGDDPSYADLAKRSLLEHLERTVEGIQTLTASTNPHDANVKAVRKMILNFRTGLDAFPYVYTNSASSDPFQALRKMLDRGYEHIGTFKDEFDAQGLALASLDRATGVWSEGIRPDRVAYARSTRVAEKRQAILDWKTEFLANILEHRAYLAAPIPSPRIPSQPRKLSKQYWGSVRDHPKADEGGHQTMARLMRGMLDKIFGKFKKLRRTGRLEKKSDLELFHDTRKQLRAALNLADEFPGTLINAEAHAEMKERLIDLITDMGAIEDQIVALLDTPKAGAPRYAARDPRIVESPAPRPRPPRRRRLAA